MKAPRAASSGSHASEHHCAHARGGRDFMRGSQTFDCFDQRQDRWRLTAKRRDDNCNLGGALHHRNQQQRRRDVRIHQRQQIFQTRACLHAVDAQSEASIARTQRGERGGPRRGLVGCGDRILEIDTNDASRRCQRLHRALGLAARNEQQTRHIVCDVRHSGFTAPR
jgi:hypothetical protein